MDKIKNHKALELCIWSCLIAFLFSCGNKKEETSNSFFLPEGSDCIEIIKADSLAFNAHYTFRALNDKHPAVVLQNYIISLDDSLSAPIELPFNFNISDIHWVGDDCYLSSDSIIYAIDYSGNTYPLVFSHKGIQSFCVSDDRILFPDDSLVVEYVLGADNVSPIINAHHTVSHVVQHFSSVYYSTGKDLFLHHDKTTYHIYSSEYVISTFAVHSNGDIFMGTKQGLLYMNPDFTIIEITPIPIQDLTIIGDDLYVIFEDNNSILLTNISNFNKLST